MIETVEHPVFTAKDFDRAHKKPGLSAIVRLKNEAEFAKAALESIAPFFDEIIIVFNDCTDRTPEIVAEFAECHANRVRAFHYVPQVVPIATKEHQRTPSHSPHSIVYYCNFALSKASYQICCKWDGDQIADPRGFQQITQYLRQLQPGSRDWWLSPWRMGYLWFTGINLWSARGQLFVHKVRPFAGWKHDIGFFPATRWITFKRYSLAEYLFVRGLVHRYAGCLFYHLKGVKKDRGINKYQLEQNPDSPIKDWVNLRWTNPELMTLDRLFACAPSARQMPRPEALGIYPSRDD